jgi:hypothetical protein
MRQNVSEFEFYQTWFTKNKLQLKLIPRLRHVKAAHKRKCWIINELSTLFYQLKLLAVTDRCIVTYHGSQNSICFFHSPPSLSSKLTSTPLRRPLSAPPPPRDHHVDLLRGLHPPRSCSWSIWFAAIVTDGQAPVGTVDLTSTSHNSITQHYYKWP